MTKAATPKLTEVQRHALLLLVNSPYSDGWTPLSKHSDVYEQLERLGLAETRGIGDFKFQAMARVTIAGRQAI